MTSPVERIIKVLNDRKSEHCVKELLGSDHRIKREESMVRRMAKRITSGAGQRCFDSGDECIYI